MRRLAAADAAKRTSTLLMGSGRAYELTKLGIVHTFTAPCVTDGAYAA